jgi:hypothetical protein
MYNIIFTYNMRDYNKTTSPVVNYPDYTLNTANNKLIVNPALNINLCPKFNFNKEFTLIKLNYWNY